MLNLRNSPFLWFALMLLVAYGVSGQLGDMDSPVQMVAPALVCVVAALMGIVKYQPGHQIRSTVAIATLLFTGGIIRILSFTSAILPDDPVPYALQMTGMVEVTEVLKEKENSLSLRCIPIGLHGAKEDSVVRFTDRYLVVRIRDAGLQKIFPGDHLVVKGWVSAIKGPSNPHAFDIRKYYKSINIRHQMTCKGNEVSGPVRSKKSLIRMTAQWQHYLSEIVRAHTSLTVAQLANALVWGERSDMDEEIITAFANSGAMHVLSVSGMHMAIIYSMLYLVLGAPGSGTFLRRMIRLSLYAMTIILYMGLTGACPAVVRSGLMIILFLVGKAMGWNTQIWNLLGFAAFLMLWINPFVMHNIGFQLSFLAMAGILLYAKPLIRYYTFKQIIFHRIWEVTAVSIAAQIFIFPLLLYHFYQFPLTFIASSLVAMPASYVIIFGALLNIGLRFLEWQWLWEIYDLACQYFMITMKWMAGLNPDMNYSLPTLANLLLTGMAVFFSVGLVYRWPKGKRIAYILGIAALMNLAWHRSVQWKENEMVIYHQYQGLQMDVILQGYCISIFDSLVTKRSADFAARGNRCFKDVIKTQHVFKSSGIKTPLMKYTPPLLEYADKRILLWQGKTSGHTDTIPITHLLVDQDMDIWDLKNFVCRTPDLLVILPAHLNRYTKNTLVRFFKDNDVNHYDISEKGYFKLDL